MADRFYLDNEGAGNAAQRFSRRAADLSGAAGVLAPRDSASGEVADLVDAVVLAATGRMYAFSDELSMLAQLVDTTIEVFNDLDEQYRL